MKKNLVWLFLLSSIVFLQAQNAKNESEARILVNPGDTKWDSGDAGSESITLREDTKTGAMELLVHYPGGHAFAPHWHDSNERIVLLEGQMSIDGDEGKKVLEAGGFAFLPARQVQKLTCVSTTRCSFYVAWDGPNKPHRVEK